MMEYVSVYPKFEGELWVLVSRITTKSGEQLTIL